MRPEQAKAERSGKPHLVEGLKRRRRILQSCFNYHARKQRCDRKRPCGGCVSRSAEASCQFMTDIIYPEDETNHKPVVVMPVGQSISLPSSAEEVQNYLKSCLARIPTSKSCLFLVDRFISSTWTMPKLDRHQFSNKMEHLWLFQAPPFSSAKGMSPCTYIASLDWPWLQLLFAIIGFTLQSLSAKAMLEVYHPTENISSLAVNAYTISMELYVICCSLKLQYTEDTLVALATCSSWQKNEGRAYLALQHSAAAISIAIEMGYHLNARYESQSFDWQLTDRRERLWWTLYIMDRNLCFILDRLPTTFGLIISTKPCRNVLIAGDHELPRTVVTPSIHAIVGREFASILDIIDETKVAIQMLSDWNQKFRLLEHLNSTLQSFEERLPPEYTLYGVNGDCDSQTIVEDRKYVADARRLTLLYLYKAMIQVNRPIIAQVQILPDYEQAAMLVQCCCKAALNIVALQRNFVEHASHEQAQYIVGSFLNVFFIYDAAITLLLAICSVPTNKDVSRWCLTIDEVDKMLFQIAHDNVCAMKCRQVIESFRTTAKRALTRVGQAWTIQDGVQDVVDIEPSDTEIPATSNDLVRHEIPFYHLDIKLCWGINLDHHALEDRLETVKSSTSSCPDDTEFSTEHGQGNEIGLDFSTLDLLQADYFGDTGTMTTR